MGWHALSEAKGVERTETTPFASLRGCHPIDQLVLEHVLTSVKSLIVNADDLGIARSTNLAIRDGHCRGLVTSASLMANMPAFEHAVEHVARPYPQLGVGIHLCLTSGRPVSAASEVPLLVGGDGRFRHGFFGLFRLLRSRQREDALAQMAGELHAQASQIDDCGLPVDHLDGHQHVHVLPGVFQEAVEIARARRLAVRLPDQRLRISRRDLARLPGRLVRGGLLKKAVLSRFTRRLLPQAVGTRRADHYFGILDTGKMTRSAWRCIVASLREGVPEVNLHPGYPDQLDSPLPCSRADLRALRSANRAAELQAVLDPSLRAELADLGVRLTRFADL